MTQTFSILLIEDELMIAEMIREMLLELNYSVMGVAKNYREALRYLDKLDAIDLIILDINLSDEKNGIDLGHLIQEKYQKPFIYLTSYSDPQTIKKAAVTEPAAYLIKPFTRGDLHATIEVIKARQSRKNQSLIIREHDMNVKISIDDIFYVKSDNNYLEVYTNTKKYVQRNSLERFLEEVNSPNFVKTHRSYIVNLNKIQAINGQNVIINGSSIPVSRKHKNELTDLFESRD